MAQHDLVIDNASGAAVRADLNNALAALGSAMKGPNAPPAPTAGMVWVDDDTPSASIWTVKQYDGAEWIELGRLDISNNIYIPSEGVIAWADVASAATVDLAAQASRNLRITGTTTITSFGAAASGVTRELRFAAALTLTHNATSLILPGGANIATAAGDTATAISLGSGNWVVVDYQRSNMAGMLDYVQRQIVSVAVGSVDFTLPAGYQAFEIAFDQVRLATDGSNLWLRGSTDGGATFLAGTQYANAATYNNNTATAVGVAENAVSRCLLSGGADNGASDVTVDGRYRFTVGSAARRAVFLGQSSVFDNLLSVPLAWNGTCWIAGGATINAIRLLASAGNISSGTFTLTGIR